MDKKIIDSLSRGMTAFGHFVEKVIGKAKEAQVSVRVPSSIQPILAIESHLSINKIKELITFGVDKVVRPNIPNLVDKTALEISEGESSFLNILKDKGSTTALHVDMGTSGGIYPGREKSKGHSSLRASSKQLPFENGFFDYVIANYAVPSQEDFGKASKELSRIMAFRGKAVIVDFHPYGKFAKKGTPRLRSMETAVGNLEEYYKISQNCGLVINDVREIFIDDVMRPLFVTEEERSAFRSIKGTPFLIFLFVEKKGT